MRSMLPYPLLAIGAVALACRSAPATHYYVLAPGGAATVAREAPGDPTGLRIGVEPFTVDPPYDRDQLVYRLGPDSVEVGFYSYHRWAAPLGELVAVAMAEGLRGTVGIGAIEPVTAAGDYSAFLRGRVIYLEEIDLPDRQLARLRLELRLIDKKGSTLWAQEVAGSVAGQNETVADVVEQLYRAFSHVVEEARASLTQALAAAQWGR